MSLYFLDLPATENWKNMVLERQKKLGATRLENKQDSDRLDKYKVVYKLSEDGNTARLFDLYTENMELDGDGIVVPLSSTYRNVITYPAGTKFVNVIGSSGDKLTGMYNYTHSSWLQVYQDFVINKKTYGFYNYCHTDHRFYDQYNSILNKECNNRPCQICNNSQNLVGGHIIIGNFNIAFNPESMMQYNQLEIGIVPICNAHNRHDAGYMIFGNATDVLMLNYKVERTLYGKEFEKVRNEKR